MKAWDEADTDGWGIHIKPPIPWLEEIEPVALSSASPFDVRMQEKDVWGALALTFPSQIPQTKIMQREVS
jgi:hypothetical protein